MKAIGYIRVSTDDQALGLEAQEAQVRSWASQHKHEITAVFSDEGISGATPIEKRPGLTAALAAMKRGSILVAAKRDRFARDPGVMIMLEQWVKRSRCKLATCDGVGADEGPTGELMAGVMDMFARFERRLIGARTSGALRAKMAKGEAAGGVAPYGYRIEDGRLEVDPGEQEALEFMRELRGVGMSLRGIVAELNASRYRPRGRVWHLRSVARFVDSPSGPST